MRQIIWLRLIKIENKKFLLRIKKIGEWRMKNEKL